MSSKDVVVIMGYNNTRIDDVAVIKNKVNKKFLATLLLCQPNITDKDKKAADHVLDVSLINIEETLDVLESWRKENNKKFIAVLPFSDKGVPIGAEFAKKYYLFGDCHERAAACLHKNLFRKHEAEENNLPQWSKKPSFHLVRSKEEALSILKYCKKKMFIKPTSEGNSRGCIEIKSPDDLLKNWDMLENYISTGIIMEEYIEGRQYSLDGIGSFFWVTEKETSDHVKFRGEIQDIVPAPLNNKVYNRLKKAGDIISEISGSLGGAVHNEAFLLDDFSVAAVEPNRRPAGGKIWDLAQIAFENLDPYGLWLDIAVEGKIKHTDFKQRCFAGVRMISAKKDGEINGIPYGQIKELQNFCEEIDRIVITKQIGDVVSANPSDNAGYVGYLIAKNKKYIELNKNLRFFTKDIEDRIEIK